MADFKLGRGDRLPSIVMTCTGGSGRALTGATIKFIATKFGSSAPSINTSTGVVVEDATAAVRRIRYDWQAADASGVTKGRYWGEFEIVYSDGLAETFPPSEPKISIIVTQDLA